MRFNNTKIPLMVQIIGLKIGSEHGTICTECFFHSNTSQVIIYRYYHQPSESPLEWNVTVILT